MHCIFGAYQRYLWRLGIEADQEDWALYMDFKHLTHRGRTDVPTWGGVIPAMVGTLAMHYELEVEIEHTAFGSEEYYEGDGVSQLALAFLSGFGRLVETITLEPAIYLLLADGHATFSETVPTSGVPVMALQLKRKESQNDRRDTDQNPPDPSRLLDWGRAHTFVRRHC